MANDVIPPMNGEKTHPLSAHARDVLRDLQRAPVPRYLINPGIRNRLARQALADEIELPAPSGKLWVYLRITAAGLAALADTGCETGQD